MIHKQIPSGNNELICQPWELKERGWDATPDGFSLHLSLDALTRYVQEYWDSMPDRGAGGRAPSSYRAPAGDPYQVFVDNITQLEVSLTGSARYDSRFTLPGC